MHKNFIFGLGTGRCGTMSLSFLLNKQIDSLITHEFYRNGTRSHSPLPWVVDEISCRKALFKIANRSQTNIGDVSFYWLNYVDIILSLYPESKFIGLIREKEKVVKSYLKKTTGTNHWACNGNSYWGKCYPKYNTEKSKAIGLYYEDYNGKMSELSEKYKNSIMIIKTDDINDKIHQSEMLDFCRISNKVFVSDICKNVLIG